MWTSSTAVADRTARSPPSGPAESRTSIGRIRFPPALKVAEASPASGPVRPVARSRDSSTSPRADGSHSPAVSITAVTGSGDSFAITQPPNGSR